MDLNGAVPLRSRPQRVASRCVGRTQRLSPRVQLPNVTRKPPFRADSQKADLKAQAAALSSWRCISPKTAALMTSIESMRALVGYR